MLNLLERIQNYTHNGPGGNDKQIDPITLYIASQAIGTIGGMVASGDQAAAGQDFQDNISDLADEWKDEMDKMTEIAEDYLPGGKAWRLAHQTAVDTAFTTAQKGEEISLSKGVDMTDYGSAVFKDVTKEAFTKSFMADYMPMAEIGLEYNKLTQNAMGKYSDLMGTGYQAGYMSDFHESSSNWMTTIGDLGNIGLNLYSMSGGFGSPTTSSTGGPSYTGNLTDYGSDLSMGYDPGNLSYSPNR